jgi:hypothetical protein
MSMMKPLLFAAALAMAWPVAAQQAPSPPAAEPSTQAPAATDGSNPDQCLKSAFDLAEKAENKRFTNEEIEKLEDLLTRMEGHCDARQFPEAQAMAKEISALIEQKN